MNREPEPLPPLLNTSGEPAQAEQPVSSTKLSWQEQKEAQAKERKRQNELKKTEERITLLEERDGEIDSLMMQEEIFTNSVKCQELAQKRPGSPGNWRNSTRNGKNLRNKAEYGLLKQ